MKSLNILEYFCHLNNIRLWDYLIYKSLFFLNCGSIILKKSNTIFSAFSQVDKRVFCIRSISDFSEISLPKIAIFLDLFKVFQKHISHLIKMLLLT